MAVFMFGVSCLIADLILTELRKRKANRCQYNCSNCKAWDCMAHYCNEKRSGKK